MKEIQTYSKNEYNFSRRIPEKLNSSQVVDLHCYFDVEEKLLYKLLNVLETYIRTNSKTYEIKYSTTGDLIELYPADNIYNYAGLKINTRATVKEILILNDFLNDTFDRKMTNLEIIWNHLDEDILDVTIKVINNSITINFCRNVEVNDTATLWLPNKNNDRNVLKTVLISGVSKGRVYYRKATFNQLIKSKLNKFIDNGINSLDQSIKVADFFNRLYDYGYLHLKGTNE